jgi:hypothetical protein
VRGHRRDDDATLEVEHEQLLGVGRLRDHVVERGADRGAGVPARAAGVRDEQRARGVAELAGAYRAAAGRGAEAAEQAADEHDVAALLVDPAVDRVGAQLLGGAQAVEHQRLERVAGAQVRDRAHDPDHQQGQGQERQHEPGQQGAAACTGHPRRGRPLPQETSWSIDSMSKSAALAA